MAVRTGKVCFVCAGRIVDDDDEFLLGEDMQRGIVWMHRECQLPASIQQARIETARKCAEIVGTMEVGSSSFDALCELEAYALQLEKGGE